MVWRWLMIFILTPFCFSMSFLPSKTMNIQCIIIFWYVKVDDDRQTCICQSRLCSSISSCENFFLTSLLFWLFSFFPKFLISLDLRVKDEIRFSTPFFQWENTLKTALLASYALKSLKKFTHNRAQEHFKNTNFFHLYVNKADVKRMTKNILWCSKWHF